MDKDTNSTEEGSEKTSQESTVGIVDQQLGNNLFAKYPALKVVAGVAGIAVLMLLLGAFKSSNNLNPVQSDASCYGYGCEPAVIIGGRVVSTGYQSNPISYGTLHVKYGSLIELTWSGSNVDRCQADWTKFKGTYMPLTIYPGKLAASQNFAVQCFKGKNRVDSTLSVIVEK